ncbi:macro domain-containing protein [Micromonospora echinofusca]|uniref:macro domain-containing protein n=1 Tax=Micromonospora echinofusca TaxID=47858 RepID=UPI001AD67C04|nr:macro domain-containing protein [Micromonospora echinofusca]
MLKLTYGLRALFGTARGLRLLAANVLAAFGLISAVVQLGAQLVPDVMPDTTVVIAATVSACLVWGMVRAYPRRRLQYEFTHPAMNVTVEVGDLFDQEVDLVVGFSDTFDTATDDRELISSDSVQGQLVQRLYGGDAKRLDRDLRAALAGVDPVGRETRRTKPKGNLLRYPLGTVAVLHRSGRRIFAVAYSRMGTDYVARSSVDNLWLSLNGLWDAVYRHGQRGELAIPLLGSGLARIDALDRESLLKMILLSFVARSREAQLCREFRVLIHPDDVDRINLLEVAAFIRTL